ncbi:hypothetical protein BV22DRAFT_1004565 [Leucogyrophana mollusca]|uniref:Uncharacterized protein n=1 Tax=Leucogyrophana mollusca TaxID=85980 RepID=A0ACB8BS75_9AGAM|nr:hypothetical protein BV22DRAFT_1004565 [Leucogyrophana mollusca]
MPGIPQLHAQSHGTQSQYQQNLQPFDLAAMVPPQFMQDLLRLNTPVGQSPNDDVILAQALYEGKRAGKTYRQALDGLHGVNNHAANLWKDYYLDHHDRFDILVSHLNGQPVTVKKPFASGSSSPLSTSRRDSNPPPARKNRVSETPPLQDSKGKGRASSSQATHGRKRNTHPTTSSVLMRPPKRSRATLNSLTAPTLMQDNLGLLPPHADIKVPEPPSRSPSPPTRVEAGTHGNRYTDEDKAYFINFLTWRLKEDPTLTKKAICELLAQKAPHHSATSWASHWHSRHDLADKILASAEVNGSDSESESDNGDSAVGSTTQDRSGSSTDSVSGVLGSDYGDPGDADTEEDEAGMGSTGTSYTRSDFRMLARHVASFTDWQNTSTKDRWESLAKKYPEARSAKSWAECYRRNDDVVDALADRFRKYSKSTKTQRGRPSWAKAKAGSNTKSPRKKDTSEDDGDYSTDEEGSNYSPQEQRNDIWD